MKEEYGIIIMTFLLLGMIIMNPNKKFLDNPPLNESNKANMFFENIFCLLGNVGKQSCFLDVVTLLMPF